MARKNRLLKVGNVTDVVGVIVPILSLFIGYQMLVLLF